MSEALSITNRTAGRIDASDRIDARTTNVRRAAAPVQVAAPRADDQVEVSSMARYLAELKTTTGIRDNVVSGVREALADGSYDVDARVDAILDRVLADIDDLAAE